MQRNPMYLMLLGLLVVGPPAYASMVTDVTLDESIATASTAADHNAIAVYYRSEASRALDQAAAHKRIGKTYKQWGPSKGEMRHKFPCKVLIRSAESTAQGYRTLAKQHREMAKNLAETRPLETTSQIEH